MRYPQVILYENPAATAEPVALLRERSSATLAELLHPLIESERWLLREPRRPEACLQLLGEVRPMVLIVRLERKLTDELTMLLEANRRAPDVPILVVNAARLGSQPRLQLTALAYDLNARCVLFPPLSEELFLDTVRSMMRWSIREVITDHGR